MYADHLTKIWIQRFIRIVRFLAESQEEIAAVLAEEEAKLRVS